MTEISAIAIDMAKSVFEIGMLNAKGRLLGRKRLKRQAFKRFMEREAPRVLVGMEAGGGTHYWARWLAGLGFEVKMMPAQVVKAYRLGPHKSDRRDVLAIGEAMVRPQVPSVPVKSETAQTLQALVRVRDRILRQRKQTAGQLRGLLGEFGIVAPKGAARFRTFLRSLEEHPDWSALAAPTSALLLSLREELTAIYAREAQADDQLRLLQQDDPNCRLLRSIPSIGAINAVSLAALLEAPELFRKGRAFASYIGIVPGEDQSGERVGQRRITKAGSSQARRLLVLAAQNLITTAQRRHKAGKQTDGLHVWALQLAERKGKSKRNVAVAAVANKLARIAWAVLASGKVYRPRGLPGAIASEPSLAQAQSA